MNYDEKSSGVYILTHINTGKIYIGSSQCIGERWYKHFEYPETNTCTKLRNAIKKHGKDAFTASILETTLPERTTLLEREQHYLDALQPFDERGYNIRKIAGSNLGVKHSDETKQRWSEAKRGDKNPMWGRRGRSDRKMAADAARRGRKFTPEHKAKLGKHLAVGVVAFHKDGTIYKSFTSLADAVREVNGDTTALWRCLHHRPNYKTHKGYIWRYSSELLDTSLNPSSL